MASKKKGGQRNDLDWDSDLDFDIPDFGSDDPAGMTDDRKPITKGIVAAAAGFGKSFTNEAQLRKTLTKSLPGEYAEPISKAFEIKNSFTDLYHIGSGEVGKLAKESKRSVNRIAKNLESSLPKGVYEKIMRWTSEEGGSGQGPTKEEIEQGSIDSAIAGIMGENMQVESDNRKKDDARKLIQDNIDKNRHEDLVTILGSVDQSLISIQTYQEKITTGFAKKSLEMQMRSYYLQNDTLQLQTKYFQLFKNDLSAITKNTGLPDYVKKATKEALVERLREKSFDAIAGTIANRRNEWLSTVTKRAGNKIKEVGGNIRDGASQVLDMVESASGMAGSGMGPSIGEMGAEGAGGIAGSALQKEIAKRIHEVTSRNPDIIKHGNKASMIARNLPQWVNEQMTNGRHADKFPDWLREILSPVQESSSIQMNREVDMEAATQFSDKNSQSLNIVIPQLLSKILNELVKKRTGDDTVEPIAYDYESGKFVTPKERQEKLKTDVVSKTTTENMRGQMDELFKQFDPDGTKFDGKTRNQIAENIYKANKQGKFFDRDGMIRAVDNDRFAEAIRQHIGGDGNAVRENKLSKTFANFGSNNTDVKGRVEALVKAGRHGELAELGLIDSATGRINMEAVRRLELGVKNDQSGTVASALGNVFDGGNVKAFAKGGVMRNKVIRKPTTFKMPTGQTGLMGEAGPEAIMPLSRDDDGRLGVKVDKSASDQTLIEIRDILKRIEEKGLGGLNPEQLAAYIKSQGSSLAEKAKGIGSKLWGATKWGNEKTINGAKRGYEIVSKAAGATKDWLSTKKDAFDVFVGDEVSPRITKAKLEAGKYINVATGKVITKLEEINGDIRDIDTGEIVIKGEEIKKIVLRNWESGKSKLGSSAGIVWKGLKGFHEGVKNNIRRLGGYAGSIYGIGISLGKKAYDKLTDGPMDVYTKSSPDTPVLRKQIMEKGLYFDKGSYDTIFKVSDIRGAVVDNEGDVVLTKEDMMQGLFDKNGQEIKTGFDRIKQLVGNSINKSVEMYKKVFAKGKDLLTGAFNKTKDFIGGEGKLISIGGPSGQTNAILSAIYNLLNDRMPGDRSAELGDVGATAPATAIKNNITQAVEVAKEKLDKVKAKVKEKTPKVKAKAEKKFEEVKSEVEKKIEEVKAKATPKVEQLRQKALEKATKAKERFEAAKEASKKPRTAIRTAVTSAKEKIVEKADTVKEVVTDHKKDDWLKARKLFQDKKEEVKDKAATSVDRLYKLMEERLPKPKEKVIGDRDGDGIRDNSFEDLRRKAKEMKEKGVEKAGAVGEKIKGNSIYAALAGLLKKKKDDAKEEEGGVGLEDVLGGGGGGANEDPRDAKRKRRLARARANRPKGLIGRTMARAGNAIKKIPGAGAVGRAATRFGGSAAGRGLGMIGRGAMAAGGGALSMLGGNFLGGAGRLAMGAGSMLLGGGLSSAGILSGGIGLLGSALGMAGTAAAAIISSPITVPLLAAAAVGTAGYFAYKWLSKKDPSPLEKVRLVQYGFRADDTENYKKVMEIESKVSSAVTFQGEKAQFDSKRLNIQDLMKVFNLDINSKADAEKFIDWFAGRFRPLYLNHRALIKTTGSPKQLADVDENSFDFKKSYLSQCLFPGEYYSMNVNPNKDKRYLYTFQSDVEKQIVTAQEEILKDSKKKPEDEKTKAAGTAALAAAAAKKKAEEKPPVEEKTDDKADNPERRDRPSTKSTVEENRRKAAYAGVAAASAGMGPGDDLGGIANQDGTPTSPPKSRSDIKPKTGDAAIVKETLIKEMPKYGITTPNQQAALLGNVDHESGFRPIAENLNYKPQTMVKLWPNRFPNMTAAAEVAAKGPEGIANSIYGKRMGNTDPNDGWDYRGRGPMQLTGKSNYEAVSKIIGKDIVKDPDKLITDPKASAESAIAFWKMNPQLGKAADAGNFAKVRQIVNGGSIGAEDALEKTSQYLEKIRAGDLEVAAKGTQSSYLVDSPKPTPTQEPSKAPTSSVVDNPNAGPTPSSFAPKKAPIASEVSQAAPSISSTVAAPANAKSRVIENNQFYQNNASINTGDAVGVLKKSNDELILHTTFLERIAVAIEAMPAKIAELLNVPAPEVVKAPTPSAPKPPPRPLAQASQSFRRSLSGI